MKKLSSKRKRHQIRKQWKLARSLIRRANRRRYFETIKAINRWRYREYYLVHESRQQRNYEVYRNKLYDSPPIEIIIDQDFGIENPLDVKYFLDTAEQIADFNSKELYLNIENCSRVWPSAITLLCSLKQMVELTSTEGNSPKIKSSTPQNAKVNSYLAHCGFYEYVSRKDDSSNTTHYNSSSIVKIERETDKTQDETRAIQIMKLLESHSSLSSTEQKLFNNIVLSEVLGNVTEHGVSKRDNGWWLIAQHHPTHNYISLCIADNGIGIRNSLMSGPQRIAISKNIPDDPSQDGKLIKYSFNEKITGAIEAPHQEAKSWTINERGPQRGRGLNEILETCAELNIKFNLLSHYGYIFHDENGKVIMSGSRGSKIFAGTLYHFIIKT